MKELEFAITQSAFTSIRDGLNEELELARIALASLDAEPVGEVSEKRHGLVMDGTVDLGGKSTYRIIKGEKAMKRLPLGTKFYIAPPAPVVPEEITDESTEQRLMGRRWAHSFCAGWNACRAAMLQSKYRDLSQPVDPQISEYERIMLQAGNSPVIPDGWISCSERMPAQDDWVLIYSKHGEYLAGQVQGEYVELNDGTLSWLGSALHWMLLPEPPQEVK
ncbi:DUF551 domain-containing protein [Salmonella enterica]|nr:DUF551 domain-containing protein [Salmonella enterica]